MTNEKFEVRSMTPERKFVMVYHDFLRNVFLTTEEQMAYIALRSFLNFSGNSGDVFPGMETLCLLTAMSKPRVIKAIKGLEKKGIVKKERRGLSKTNIYTLVPDVPELWKAETEEEIASAIDEIEEQKYIDFLRAKGYTVEKAEKEKDPVPETDQSTETEPNKNQNDLFDNDIKPDEKNQSVNEKYSVYYVKQIYDYDILVNDYKEDLTMIDAVMEILHDTLNTQRDYIRIGGENKPAMVVISRLLKLDYMNILYSIRKYQEQTERIKNPEAYLLTILFKSKEQSILDIQNLVQHNMAEYDMN